MEKYLIFCILSIPIIFISRKYIFDFKSHGFYRLLSWECILWLAVSNYKYWFYDSFGNNQIIAWILLFISLFWIVAGMGKLGKAKKSGNQRNGENLYTFEKTSELIDTGIYKYIRHPLYSSLLFLTWGIFFKNTTIELLIVSLASSIFLYLTARCDEKECIAYFEDKYEEYMNRTTRFVPFLF